MIYATHDRPQILWNQTRTTHMKLLPIVASNCRSVGNCANLGAETSTTTHGFKWKICYSFTVQTKTERSGLGHQSLGRILTPFSVRKTNASNCAHQFACTLGNIARNALCETIKDPSHTVSFNMHKTELGNCIRWLVTTNGRGDETFKNGHKTSRIGSTPLPHKQRHILIRL